MRVVVAQDLAAAGQGVLVELAGLVVLPQCKEIDGEVVGRFQGVGVVVAQSGAAQVQGAFEQGPGRAGFPPDLQI